MDKRPTSLTILAMVAITAIGLVFVLNSQIQKSKEAPPSLPKVTSYAPREAKANPNQETEVGSPDGKLTLTVKAMPAGRQEEKEKDAATFIFFITEKATGVQKEIYREVGEDGSITIPFNTFSPDNKYFFLKKEVGGKTSYFVLSTAGIPLTKDSAFMEFSNSFENTYPDYKIDEVTGWGGLSLIVINTKKVNGGEGPSFWVDVPSGKFTQLSSHFN